MVDTAAELMALVTYILPPRSILTIPYGGCFWYILLVIKHNAAIKSRTLGSKTAGWILPSGNVCFSKLFEPLPVGFNFGTPPLLHFRSHLVHDSEANSSVPQSHLTVRSHRNAKHLKSTLVPPYMVHGATGGETQLVARALPPALLLISIRARFHFNTFHFQRSSFCPVQTCCKT